MLHKSILRTQSVSNPFYRHHSGGIIVAPMKIFDDEGMPKYIIGPWLQSYSSKSNDNWGYGYQLGMINMLNWV